MYELHGRGRPTASRPLRLRPLSITEISVDNYIAIESCRAHSLGATEQSRRGDLPGHQGAGEPLTALLNGEYPDRAVHPAAARAARRRRAERAPLLGKPVEIIVPGHEHAIRALWTEGGAPAVAYRHSTGRHHPRDPPGPGDPPGRTTSAKAQVGFDPEPARGLPLRSREGARAPRGGGLSGRGSRSTFYHRRSAATPPTSRSPRRSCRMLEAVGFKVNLQTPEWGTLWSNVQRRRRAVLLHGPRLRGRSPRRRCSQYFEDRRHPRGHQGLLRGGIPT